MNKRTKLYTRENLVKTWQSLKTLRARWFKREKRKEKKRKEKKKKDPWLKRATGLGKYSLQKFLW